MALSGVELGRHPDDRFWKGDRPGVWNDGTEPRPAEPNTPTSFYGGGPVKHFGFVGLSPAVRLPARIGLNATERLQHD